jgi:hypothetical protein
MRSAGSITLWSRPTASDCASASACWKRDVSLSIRMDGVPSRFWGSRIDLRGRNGHQMRAEQSRFKRAAGAST